MSARRLIAFALLAMAWMGACAADPIEGRWQVNAGGAVFDVKPLPGNSGALAMLWVDGPDFSIAPGTEIGTLYPTAAPGTYDCHAATDPRRQGLRKRTADFVVKFSSDDANLITFAAFHRNKRVSLWRWIPYFFRLAIIKESDRPENLEGARRINSQPPIIEL